jgi:hypothetical protein
MNKANDEKETAKPVETQNTNNKQVEVKQEPIIITKPEEKPASKPEVVLPSVPEIKPGFSILKFLFIFSVIGLIAYFSLSLYLKNSQNKRESIGSIFTDEEVKGFNTSTPISEYELISEETQDNSLNY